ncbi:MAG: glycoside hydrolase family 3 protein [Treponema sp.]|nr:glycoside hydrolase family 3 protein [Treponema sp.]
MRIIGFVVKITIFLFVFHLLSCLNNNLVNPDNLKVNNIETENYIDPLKERAAEIVSLMDERLLAAQVLISGVDGRETLPLNSIDLLTEIPAGGIMLFRYNLSVNNSTIRSFLAEISILISEKSGIKPFMAVDHEGGSVNRFSRDITTLPAAVSYWDIFLEEGRETALEKIKNDSFKSAQDINILGINMNFAPVAEYLIDENRVFMASRSYGPDPLFTFQAALAFIQGMERAGIICVVKHFPGSAGTDPHYSASVLNWDKPALDKLVSPFSLLINNGARAIMAAHTLTPVIDSKIASLSSVVMKDWLRDELGFDGIIISDDFIMAAAGSQKPEDAAVSSIAAGSDMILVWPAHLRTTHQAILNALQDGTLSRERLADAVQRIVYEKLKMGLIEF